MKVKYNTAGRRILAFLLIVCMVLGLVPGVGVQETHAANSWSFGNTGGTSGTPNSLTFTLGTIGMVASLYKYNDSGGRINKTYCTEPYTSFYIGTDQFSSLTSWGGLAIGDGVIAYYATDAAGIETEVTSYGASSPQWRNAVVQRAEVKWQKPLTGSNAGVTATIIWNVRYTAGDSNFTHEWLVSADDDVVGGLDVYYGGHHMLGGGNEKGYTYYDAVNKGIYTWGLEGNNNGLYVLRSDGAVEPHSYWSGHASYTGTYITPYTSTRRALPADTPPPATIEYVAHTCFYMHWKETDTLSGGNVWKVEATEGIVSEGQLSVISPAGKTVPPGVTTSYDFLIMNMTPDTINLDLTPSLSATALANGWTAAMGTGSTLTLSGYSDFDTVSVDVTIPNTAATNDFADLTLTAEIASVTSGSSATVGESAEGFVTTTVDENVAAITDVMEMNLTRATTDVRVTWSNHPGSHMTTVDIYDVNGVTRLIGGTASISSGGLVTGIDTSMLVSGETYRIRAVVDGIEYPHFQRTFVMRGDEASGYVWRDIDKDGTRAAFEGIYGVDVRMEETKADNSAYVYETTSQARGIVGFGADTTNMETHVHDFGSEYVIYPELNIYEYAISGIKVTADGVAQTSDITTPGSVFEYLTLSAPHTDNNGNSTLATSYKFQPTKTAQISLEMEVSQAAVLDIYAHTGSVTPPAATDYVNGGAAEIVYDSITLAASPMTVPHTASVAAGSSPVITYSAPHGYRHATRGITESVVMNNLPAYALSGSYPVYFEMLAGDLRLTGVSDVSGTPRQAAITTGSSAAGTAASPNLPVVEVDSNWMGVNAQLDFSVWDSSANAIANPDRSGYTWKLDSDPNDIIQTGSFDPTDGTFTFSGNTGQANVKVTSNTAPYLSHDMIIEVGTGATAAYSDLYIAKAGDSTLARVDHLALLTGGEEELVVVGVDGTGAASRLRNTDAALISSDINTATVTAVPSATSLYNFTLKAERQGSVVLTASEPSGLTTTANVLVTTASLNDAWIEITPNPVNLTSGGVTAQVTYTLRFANNAATMTLDPAFVTPAVADTTVASISSTDNDYLEYLSDGNTTLSAVLTADPAVSGSAAVVCSTGGSTVTPQGELMLQEAAGSNTGGMIEEGATAEYFAFFDTNGNGVYDAGTDELLPYNTANTTFSSANGNFTTAIGTFSTDNVELTGLSAGGDELVVAYTLNGVTYTASADILVYESGYALSGLEVTPEITVLHVGEVQTYVVKAVYRDGSNTVSYTLPSSMYTGAVVAGDSYAVLASGTENKVEAAAATGEVTYRATLASDTTVSADAAILVVPAGAYLSVSPDPLWVEVGTTESIDYELLDSSHTVITVPNLADYVSASISTQTTARFDTSSGSADIETAEGVAAGRTTLTAYLHGQTVMETITLYVWDDSSTGGTTGIVWNPDPLNINAGYSGISSVYLLDASGSQAAMVDLEHLDSLTSTNTAVATIPAAPAGTALTVTGEAVTVNSSAAINAVCPAGSADLTVNVTTGTTVNGLAAQPEIIELWPGETKTVTVTNTATGLPLDAAQLTALGKALTDLSGTATTENDVAVDSANAVLEISQAGSGVITGSVNVLTLTVSGGASATVYVINHTEDPYQNGYSRALELNPDPSWVALNSSSNSADVAAVLTVTDSSGSVIDTITLPGDIVTWTSNTTVSLPGRIAMTASANAADTVTLTGQTAGAQTYSVAYSGGMSPLTADGSVFVYARDNAGIDFELEPPAVVMTPNDTQGVRGVITYTNGSTQYIMPQELSIAVPDLASADTTTAAITNGIIRAQALGGDDARFTYVDGTLVGTSLTGRVDVLVYNPGADMAIDPDSILVWTPGGSVTEPNTEDIATWIGNVQIPNVFLSYTALHNNISLTPHTTQDDEYTVTGVQEGTTTITALLVNTSQSATAQAEVRDHTRTYYMVDYDDNGGSGSMASYTVAQNGTHTAQPNGFDAPSAAEYFTGWNTQADGLGTPYDVGDPVVVTGNITLFAQWDMIPPTYYTVTYDDNGGIGGSMSPDTDVPGATYTVQPNGYTAPSGKGFLAWNTQPGGTGTSYNPGDTFTLNSDVILYAIWEDLYTVDYDATTGSGGMTADTGLAGSTYTVPPCTFTPPTGEQFQAWNTQADGLGTSYDPGDTFTLTADVTLYAIWEPLPAGSNYTVSFDNNGGQGSMSAYTGTAGTMYTVPASTFTAPSGDQFKEWNTQADGLGTSYDPGDTFTLTADVTLYAIWEPVPVGSSYTVTFDNNGGQGAMSAYTGAAGTTYTVPASTLTAPTGKQFKEWNTAASGGGTSYDPGDTFTLAANVTLYAIWEDIPAAVTYTVAYENNGGSGVMTPYTVEENTVHTVQPNGFTPQSGYYFKGWNTQADEGGTGYSVGDSITVTDNMTLYAIWDTIQPGTTFTVSYDGNGAAGSISPDTAAPGTSYTVQGNGFTVSPGKRFVTWNTAPDGSGTSHDPSDTFTLHSDVILYAIWENVYTVTYHDNGADSGAAPADSTVYTDGGSVTILGDGGLVKAGYTFRGWATNSAGTGQVYLPGADYLIDGSDVDFYAVWDDDSAPAYFRLTVQAGTGGSVDTSVNGYYQAGETVTITAAASSGYQFTSWSADVSGILASATSATTTLTMPGEDVTATASFTRTSTGSPGGSGGNSSYTITYKANGGEGEDHKVTNLTSGASHTVLSRTAAGMSYSGYTFTSWNTRADGSGTSYSTGDTIHVTSSLTLYAQWEAAGGSDLSGILDTENHIAYISGYTDGTVRPDHDITRAEAAAIFYRLLKNPGTASGGAFSDVASGEWYAQSVNFLASIDILDGYSDGAFRPNNPITRAEFATMASRFDALQDSGSNAFRDVPDSHWAVRYIRSAYANGWINGYSDSTFRPENNITRAEVVTIVNAMLNRSVDSESLAQISNSFHDIPTGHWAYADIIEASTVHEYERDDDGKELWLSW